MQREDLVARLRNEIKSPGSMNPGSVPEFIVPPDEINLHEAVARLTTKPSRHQRAIQLRSISLPPTF